MTGASVPRSSARHCSYTVYTVLTVYTDQGAEVNGRLQSSVGGGEGERGTPFELKEHRQIPVLF